MITDYGATFLRSRPRTVVGKATARDSVIRRLDWSLLLAVTLLCVVGLLLVWSATRTQLLVAGANPRHFLNRQGLNIAMGLICGLVVLAFDYRLLRAYGLMFYVLCCLALALVPTPLGATINGAQSWLVLPGGLQVQPSEFAKVALLLMLAMLLGEPRDGGDDPRDRDVAQALLAAVIPMGLIMLQPDLGTVLVFGVTVLGVVGISGAPRRWFVGLIAAVVLAAAGGIYFKVLEPYQLDRFTAFANPAGAPEAVTYSSEQARLAIGSGGLFGKGLFNGSLTSGQYVPEQHSDFIFTVAGEELGFVGCAAIVALLGVVLWRALRIAVNAEDAYGMVIAGGVVCWFGFQTFQNIGMSVGLMPVTGLPLPFVSYGGSAMVANLVAVALLENVHLASTHRRVNTKW